MTAQHAPGPWYAFGGYDDDNPQYTVESSVTIAYIRESTFNPNPKATAQLFAAAPDLLEVLKEIVGFWDSIVPIDCVNDCVNDLHVKARAAIAKATTE
jgi:hypothetical protein